MKWLVYIVFFSSFQLYAQSSLKPYIRIGSIFSIYSYTDPITIDANITGGIYLNDHIGFGIGASNIKDLYGQLDIVTFSVMPSYRILNSKHIFSPLIGLELNTQLWSNANGKFVGNGYEISSIPYISSIVDYSTRYKGTPFMGRVKLLADFKIKSFNLSIGPTFNLMYIKLEKVKKNNSGYVVLSEGTDRIIGVGGEISLMYTFPMKKRQAKKQAKQVGE